MMIRKSLKHKTSFFFVATLCLLIDFTNAFLSSLFLLRNRPKHMGHPFCLEIETAFSVKPDFSLLRKHLRRTAVFATEDGDDSSQQMTTMISTSTEQRRLGVLVLCTVPLAWGTFEPAVRFVYKVQPPVPGFVFSVAYYLVSTVTLSIIAFLTANSARPNADDNDCGVDGNYMSNKQRSLDLPIQGGLELGSYLFVGNALQVLGLKTVPSDRAAFLLQLTTIFVPLLQAIGARNLLAVPIRTWVACWIALCGVAVMSVSDHLSPPQDITESVSTLLFQLQPGQLLSQGDLLIVAAAVAYTFHCIRVERYAKETKAVYLATFKSVTETVLCGVLVAGLAIYSSSTLVPDGNSAGRNLESFALESGEEIISYFRDMAQGYSDGLLASPVLLPALAAVLWTGWITIAYTIYAQSFGQSRVNPTDANLIYTIQPICTAVVAFLLLGETLGVADFLGGAMIGSAVLMVATSETQES